MRAVAADASNKPTYNLIIGPKRIAKRVIVLDFDKDLICINKQFLLISKVNGLRDPNKLRNQFTPFLEPKSTQEATNRATEILDANHKKADS